MTTITVRGLDDEVQRRLKARAATNDRSMEAEVRAILTEAVGSGRFIDAWLAMAAEFGVELPLPARSAPRDVRLA